MVTPLTLTVYELATNAFKHGCLKQPGGRLSIAWETTDGDAGSEPAALTIVWREHSPSPVAAPAPGSAGGFGYRLIDALIVQLSGRQTIAWEEDGLHMTLVLPLEVSV